MPSQKETRPTLLQIARSAGVSLTAVSMAMRNHPRIGADTKARIHEVAKRLGYHPDPQLSRLMLHLRSAKTAGYEETIAYVCDFARLSDWYMLSQSDYYLGAIDRAAELGYRVEIFHLREPGLTQQRLSHMLKSRGIRGLLTNGLQDPGATLVLDWENFATVVCSAAQPGLAVDHVSTDYYRAMLMVVGKLASEGCKRIGFCLNATHDIKGQHLWESAYLYFQHNLPVRSRLPVLYTRPGTFGTDADAVSWLGTARPDTVISAGCDFPRILESRIGKPAPSDIKYVNMGITYADARSRSVDQMLYLVGYEACNRLIELLQHNKLGFPAHPQSIWTGFEWIEDWHAWHRVWQQRNNRLRYKAVAVE
jgi:DNA-binding LacI/PurR family transcriptional regulator